MAMLSAEMRETIEKNGWSDKWRQEGKLEGIKEGELKGIEKGKLEIAKALFEDDFTIEDIKRFTGLPLDMLKEKLLPPPPPLGKMGRPVHENAQVL